MKNTEINLKNRLELSPYFDKVHNVLVGDDGIHRDRVQVDVEPEPGALRGEGRLFGCRRCWGRLVVFGLLHDDAVVRDGNARRGQDDAAAVTIATGAVCGRRRCACQLVVEEVEEYS